MRHFLLYVVIIGLVVLGALELSKGAKYYVSYRGINPVPSQETVQLLLKASRQVNLVEIPLVGLSNVVLAVLLACYVISERRRNPLQDRGSPG